LIRRLAGLLGAILLLDSCASAFFYDIAVARNEKTFLWPKKAAQPARPPKPASTDSTSTSASTGESSAAAASGAAETPTYWIDDQPYETVHLRSRDGLDLVAYWLPSKTPNADTVILAHGYSSRARHMSAFAQLFSEELGMNVLMPDARGHGDSGGAYIGFGWPERLDYLDWIDWVNGRVGTQRSVVLHGVSMGGATVMMVSGESLPPNVKAIVEDCGYTSAEEELGYQVRKMYGVTDPAVLRDTSRLTKRRAGYSFEEASALEQVKKSVTPTLFIHGEADTFVPYEMVSRLYAACSAEKALFTVPGAAHAMSFFTDPAGYRGQIRRFLAQYVDERYAGD
jgi:fermentation-respiration switch protein FrsA (DUF1100 family)